MANIRFWGITVAGIFCGIIAAQLIFSNFLSPYWSTTWYNESDPRNHSTHLELYGKVLQMHKGSITIETDSLYPPARTSVWNIAVPENVSVTNMTRPRSHDIIVSDYVTLYVPRTEGPLAAAWNILVKKHE
jgi:hypothetical protein